MTRGALRFAILLAVAVAAVGCEHDTETTSFPPSGTQAWGTDNCLYTSLGTTWVKGLWCRRPINDTVTDYYLGDSIQYRIDESDAQYYQWYDHALDRWYAQDRQTQVVYVKTTDGRLLTPYAYWQEQAQPQTGVSSPGVAPSNTTPTGSTETVPSTAPVEYWQMQQRIQEAHDRVWRRILAPDCVGSYNGCA